MVKFPFPLLKLDSIKRISPPTLVHAKPVATPATSLFKSRSLSNLIGPNMFSKSDTLTFVSYSCSIAMHFAANRITLLITFSKPLTPDSLVYPSTIFSNTLLGNSKSLLPSPCSFSCFGRRCFLAIETFSSTV